jgi:hypothetical protein
MCEHPAEEIAMDAYTSHILQLSNARVDDLRREAAERALSRAARGSRTSRWAGIRSRFARPVGPAIEPVAPFTLRRPAPHEEELRRIA